MSRDGNSMEILSRLGRGELRELLSIAKSCFEMTCLGRVDSLMLRIVDFWFKEKLTVKI